MDRGAVEARGQGARELEHDRDPRGAVVRTDEPGDAGLGVVVGPDHDRARLSPRDRADDVAVRPLHADAVHAGLTQARREHSGQPAVRRGARGARADPDLGLEVRERPPLVEARGALGRRRIRRRGRLLLLAAAERGERHDGHECECGQRFPSHGQSAR